MASSTEDISKRLSALSTCAMEIAMGNFAVKIPLSEQEDELTEIATALELMRQDIDGFIKQRDEKIIDLQEKLSIIEKQRQAILELSTPVIRIWEDIVILPLIGTVDTPRAQQIMENLLEAIAETQTQVAIIDITGVPVVDATVAQHFIRAMDATKILGAETILTGVSPYNAQTLVTLGLDLTKITTKATLEAGLKLAFDITKNKVTKRNENATPVQNLVHRY